MTTSREPDRTVKPLNPVSAAGLKHAVMSLNLGSVGVDDWTLGRPSPSFTLSTV